jgi:putative transposase
VTRPHRDQQVGIHHATARGNARGAIYLDDEDRALYRYRLEWTAHDFDWDVLLWCLMTNHVHLLIETRKPNLSAGMQQLHGRYAQLFNERHRRTGHLFGGRFWSVPVETDEHFEIASHYILDNPVAAGLVLRRQDWPWLGGTIVERHGARAPVGPRLSLPAPSGV